MWHNRFRDLPFRLIFLACVFTSCTLSAAIITVTTNDNYTKIEAAQSGDEVIISPGTYAFRVYLTKAATSTINIHALDPANPPVWDFGTNLLDNVPGSYTAGDKARGGWQFSGARNYTISGIVFRNCRNAAKNAGAIRYYSGTTNLVIRNCFFALNDNGLTGGTQDSQATVEFCEFSTNGNPAASLSAPTHSIYIYGGYLAFRYCYVHDIAQGQNFHIRCRDATLEYNWFARANNYDGDLMTDDDFSGAGPFTQTLTLRGNVFVQNPFPGNHSQVISVFNDGALANLTLNVRALYNTFVGANTNSAFVHLSNADATRMNAEVFNNIIYGTKTPSLVEDAVHGTITGANNWLQTNAPPGSLTGSIQTPSPGFRNLAAKEFTLAPGSPCIGAATASIYGLPGKEYYLNETTKCEWRIRAAARDIGAFESTSTNAPIGPYDAFPQPRLNFSRPGAGLLLKWPLFAQDFQPQQAPALPATVWTQASYALSTDAAGVFLTAPTSTGKSFFRLKR
ncbi:MAG TPA: hypothetical protein VLT36_00365 [Candidatus Dormibacteraeota bacterium]|nr:hypothetical protein [Candidatus Dormibacteraeota bacterium]